MHVEGDDWVLFEEGSEEAALDASVSAMQRYFYRPLEALFAQLLYTEYYEQYMVTKSCPVALRGNFPELFPGNTLPPEGQIAYLDRAPGKQKCFVYRRQRGETPVCRLEMKFPRQQEVFYLRHILLHFPKANYAECRKHNGKTYSSFEQALLATGHFAKSEEAHAVLDELIALRYTASQLRFAFLVLLEQDAAPQTLFKKYERCLLKDFLDRGLSLPTAKKELLKLLQCSWIQNGKDESDWKLPESDTALTTPVQTPTNRTHTASSLLAMLRNNRQQDSAATHITDCLYLLIRSPPGYDFRRRSCWHWKVNSGNLHHIGCRGRWPCRS